MNNNSSYWLALMILAAIASMAILNLPARADDIKLKPSLPKLDKWEGVFTVDISKLPLKGKGKPNGKLKNVSSKK